MTAPESALPVASISDSIAARVRSLRASRGLGRDEVAAAARAAGAPGSLTAAALGNIETGRRYPDGRRRREVSVDELVWLAAALAVPVSQLLGEHAELFGRPAAQTPVCGDVEGEARKAVEQLGELEDAEPAIAAAAYALARKLDGDAGMAAAAIAKELRAHLDSLWRGRTERDDDDDELGAS